MDQQLKVNPGVQVTWVLPQACCVISGKSLGLSGLQIPYPPWKRSTLTAHQNHLGSF